MKNKLLKLLIVLMVLSLALLAFVACGGRRPSGSGTGGGITNNGGGATEEPDNSQPVTYTITYDANGGSVSKPTMEVEPGKPFYHPTPSRPGYYFDGWYYGSLKYEDSSENQTAIWGIKDDVTFKAWWTPIFNFDTATNTVKGFLTDNRDETSLSIPASIDGVEVLHIAEGAFINKDYLEEVYISSHVRTIGESAFENCVNLETVTLSSGDRLETLSGSVFAYCEKLTSITIPKSVVTLGTNAFFGCSALSKVTFEDGSNLETIGISAFGNCAGLKEITLPKKLKTISKNAFSYCANLLCVYLPKDVLLETIGEGAFINCTSLQEIYKSPALKTVGKNAFSGCSALVSITLPITTTSVGENAFKGCTALSILSQHMSKPSSWNFSFNPNNRPVGYGLTQLTNDGWEKQIASINRGDNISLSLANLDFVRDDIKSATFNGRSVTLSKVGIEDSGDSKTLVVYPEGVRTGDATLRVYFIKEGKGYYIESEQRLVDYKIGNAGEYMAFMNDVVSQPYANPKEIHAVLTDNVDLDAQEIGSRNQQLGTEWSCFSGSLDGQGYTVTNFKISRQGLFWRVKNATIKNIGFTNVTGSSGENQKALFCWSAGNVLMENVYMQGTMPCDMNKHVVGYCYSSSGTTFKNFIINIEFTGKVAGGEPVYAISKSSVFQSTSENVYAISQSADFFANGKPNRGSDYGKYVSLDALKNDISSLNLAKFDNGFWDITSGAPVWKTA